MDDWPLFPAYVQQMGAASPTIPDDQQPDPVEELRRVVEEVTGIKIERPSKPRIGFLP